MKKLSLLLLFGGVVTLSIAQTANTLTAVKINNNSATDANAPAANVPYNQTYQYLVKHKPHLRSNHNRGLNVIQLGSAGNAYTIIDGEVNSVAANNDINAVTFVHRADPTTPALANDNLGQYVYDVSTDGGNTWTLNQGVLNPSGNNVTLAGRYPNATIYNPTGNTNAQNAYLGYVGAWLPYNNGTGTPNFQGFFAGVARLNNNPSTFTENITSFNGGNVDVAHGLCNGQPGIFWACDFSRNGTTINGLLLYKGTWSASAHDIVWQLAQTFSPTFDVHFDGTPRIASPTMAFDPTGRYGYLVATGDIDSGSTNGYRPFVYKTTDAGATWTGPISIILDSLPRVKNSIDTLFPSTAFDLGVVVDVNGNPHIQTIIGAGTDYSILTGTAAKLSMFDITLNSKGEWEGLFLDTVKTFRGTFGGSTTFSCDNRPQTSITPDGKIISFGWLDSDPNFTGGANSSPNLRTRAYNINTGLADTTENITAGDSVWDGQALFSTFAKTSLVQGTIVTVPTVFMQLNPNTVVPTDPANFFYLQDVKHTTTNLTHDITPPVITIAGCNPASVLINTTYTDGGATATDNLDGNLTSSIITTNGVNTAVAGTYYVTYTVTDAAGNNYTTTRKVFVISTPNTTPPTMTLNGAASITINKCGYFTDPGATAISAVEGNITSKITTNIGSLPLYNGTTPGTPGTYTLTYKVVDCAGNADSITRTVIIQSTAPVITLSGGDTISLQPCNSFRDPGAAAYDNCLGSVTVTVSGSVDTSRSGTYTLNYKANNGTDTSSATRYVIIEVDTTPAAVTLVGSNPSYVYLGTTYTDTLPTATSCSGIDSIVSNYQTSVNTTSRGNDTVTYTVNAHNGTTTKVKRVVIVNTEPDPDFTFVYSGANNVKFTDASLYNPTAWAWNFGDSSTSTQANPNHPYVHNGPYNVCLSSTNAFNNAPFNKPVKKKCENVNFTVGINEAAMKNAFTLYPNPTTGEVTLDVNASGFDKLEVSVYNVLGENVKTLVANQVLSQSKYTIDLTNFAKGVYLVKIQTEKGSITKKVTLLSGK